MRRLLLSICLSFISINYSALGNYPHYYWLPKLFNAPYFQIELEDLIKISQNNKSPYASLDSLLKKYPGLKSTYTLVHTSRSLQKATEDKPRIIFYTPNGVFFSFASHDKADRMEIISFNQEQRQFDFTDIEFTSDKPRINRKPKTCFACHQGQPIWDNYNKWPGVYGGLDDYVFIKRMKPDDFVEREKLNQLIQSKSNRYLRLLGANTKEFFLTGDHKVSLENIFSPKRRNSYFLFHLGYFSLLTQFDGIKPGYSNNLSLLGTGKANYGGEFPYQLAAKTMLLGFEANDLYQYVDFNGNRADKLRIPPSKREQYKQIYQRMGQHTRKHHVASLVKCIDCHSLHQDDYGAPYIPFDNMVNLKKYLSRKVKREELLWRISFEAQATEDRMPPEVKDTLSARDQQALIDLFIDLTKDFN